VISTRRELLTGARASSEQRVLRRLIAVEQLLAYSYAQVLAAGVVTRANRGTLVAFAEHERQHVEQLARVLEQRGGVRPGPPSSVDQADRSLAALHVTAKLSRLRAETDAVQLLIGAEAAAIGAYYLAVAKPLEPALLTLAAEAMANDAQHATELRRLLHPRSVSKYVPNPFVAGMH